MNPAALRAICDSLNDERGTGGQTKLARLHEWHHSTVWRKLARSVGDHRVRCLGHPEGRGDGRSSVAASATSRDFGSAANRLLDRDLSAVRREFWFAVSEYS